MKFYTTGGNAHVRYLFAALPVAGALSTIAFRVFPFNRRNTVTIIVIGGAMVLDFYLLRRFCNEFNPGGDTGPVGHHRGGAAGGHVRDGGPRAAPDRTRERLMPSAGVLAVAGATLALALANALATPPFTGNDEAAHIAYALAVADGNLPVVTDRTPGRSRSPACRPTGCCTRRTTRRSTTRWWGRA